MIKKITKQINGPLFLVLILTLFCAKALGAGENDTRKNPEIRTPSILNTYNASATTHRISGSLVLPQPNNRNVEFILNLCSNGGNLNPSGCLYYAIVVIPPGQITGSYSIEIPSELVTDWDLRYSCSSCAPPLLREGYYDGSGSTTWDKRNRALLSSGQDHTNIKIIPEIGSIISGTISFYNNINIDSGGHLVDIFTKTADNPNVYCCQINSIWISPGSNFVTYSIAVPPTSTLRWHVEYNCYFGSLCGNPEVFTTGYYSTNSNGTTTQYFTQRSLLSGGEDHHKINLTLFPVNNPASILPFIMLLLGD